MILGIPKEIKEFEYRIPITPYAVKEIVERGHKVLIEKGACDIKEFSDDVFKNSGAEIIEKPEVIWNESQIILKVKEPQILEYKYFRKNLILFTFLHLASNPELTKELLKNEVIAIGYETIQTSGGFYPILSPMSEIAGKLAPQLASHFLLKYYGKKGVLIGGVTGVSKANIVIIGAGTVGFHAAKISVGMGGNTTILDTDINKLKQIENYFKNEVHTLYSSEENILKTIQNADIIIGAVYVNGAKTPKIITKSMLSLIPDYSILCDVSIDQGGFAETSKPTSHHDPVYEVDHILHYAVPNIPSLVAKTSIQALNNAILPYVLILLENSLEDIIHKELNIISGIQCYKGQITHLNLSKSLNLEYKNIKELI